MSVALLLITHQKIASSLLEVTASIVNETDSNTDYIEVPMDAPLDIMENSIRNKLSHLEQNDGLLLLTDIYGGSPSNLASKFNNQKKTRLISGLNLPMLVKIMNYRNLPLNELSEKALSGGRENICIQEESIH